MHLAGHVKRKFVALTPRQSLHLQGWSRLRDGIAHRDVTRCDTRLHRMLQRV